MPSIVVGRKWRLVYHHILNKNPLSSFVSLDGNESEIPQEGPSHQECPEDLTKDDAFLAPGPSAPSKRRYGVCIVSPLTLHPGYARLSEDWRDLVSVHQEPKG